MGREVPFGGDEVVVGLGEEGLGFEALVGCSEEPRFFSELLYFVDGDVFLHGFGLVGVGSRPGVLLLVAAHYKSTQQRIMSYT